MEGVILLKCKSSQTLRRIRWGSFYFFNTTRITLSAIIDKFPPVQTIDKDFERLVPRFLNLEYGSPESKEVAKKIREYYFKNQVFDASTYREYTDVSVRLLSAVVPVRIHQS